MFLKSNLPRATAVLIIGFVLLAIFNAMVLTYFYFTDSGMKTGSGGVEKFKSIISEGTKGQEGEFQSKNGTINPESLLVDTGVRCEKSQMAKNGPARYTLYFWDDKVYKVSEYDFTYPEDGGYSIKGRKIMFMDGAVQYEWGEIISSSGLDPDKIKNREFHEKRALPERERQFYQDVVTNTILTSNKAKHNCVEVQSENSSVLYVPIDAVFLEDPNKQKRYESYSDKDLRASVFLRITETFLTY